LSLIPRSLLKRSIAVGAVALLGLRAIPRMMPAPPSRGRRSNGGGGRKPAIVWFRNDLRLHDNEALAVAAAQSTSVLPVYCFDPREYGKSPSGFDKTGPNRARFILDSVHDLREQLRSRGSDLVVRVGRPEEVLPALVAEVGAGAVHMHWEVTYEDMAVESKVREALEARGAQLKGVWGGTLYHSDDLPFKTDSMPACYADFRVSIKSVAVRPSVETPEQLKGLPLASVEPGSIPTLQQLGFDSRAAAQATSQTNPVHRLGVDLRGGESQALQHLSAFIRDLQQTAAMQRQQLQRHAQHVTSSSSGSGAHRAQQASSFTCKISPWLAMGCLSPRRVFQEMKAAGLTQMPAAQAAAASPQQQLQGKDRGEVQAPGAWLQFELMWRDFFRFITHRYSTMGLHGAGAGATAGTLAAA